MMQDRGALLTGLGLGIGLMYFLDPDRGRRRRALLRDQFAHAAAVSSRALGATGRDMLHRATGTAARARDAFRHQRVDDDVLTERVRARLGRIASHPRALDITTADGVVTLRGQILESEVPRVVNAVQAVKGVCDVLNELQVQRRADGVPALQGAGRPQRWAWTSRWSPTTRALVCTTGTVLVGIGATKRNMPGTLIAAAGAGLVTRAATNHR